MPDAPESLAVDQGSDAVGAGPVGGFRHQVLFAAVLEDVTQARHLGLGLVGDRDHVVAAGPELPGPVVETAGLPGEVALEAVQEAGQLLRVLRGDQQVVVRRRAHHDVDLHRVELLRAGEDAEGDVAEALAGFEEEAGLERAAGDLHHAARGDGRGRDVAQFLGHTLSGGQTARSSLTCREAPAGRDEKRRTDRT